MDTPGMDTPGMDSPGMDTPGMDTPGIVMSEQMKDLKETYSHLLPYNMSSVHRASSSHFALLRPVCLEPFVFHIKEFDHLRVCHLIVEVIKIREECIEEALEEWSKRLEITVHSSENAGLKIG